MAEVEGGDEVLTCPVCKVEALRVLDLGGVDVLYVHGEWAGDVFGGRTLGAPEHADKLYSVAGHKAPAF